MPSNLIGPVLGGAASLIPGIGPIAGPLVGALASGLTSQSAAQGNQQDVQGLVNQALGIVNNSAPQTLQRYLALASNTSNPSLNPAIKPAQAGGYGLGMTNTQGTAPQGVNYSSVLAALPQAT